MYIYLCQLNTETFRDMALNHRKKAQEAQKNFREKNISVVGEFSSITTVIPAQAGIQERLNWMI